MKTNSTVKKKKHFSIITYSKLIPEQQTKRLWVVECFCSGATEKKIKKKMTEDGNPPRKLRANECVPDIYKPTGCAPSAAGPEKVEFDTINFFFDTN